MTHHSNLAVCKYHDDVIKWKHFPRYWPFVRGIYRSPVNSPHKGQWRGALMFSLICVWINGWVNNREAGDMRRHRVHYEVTILLYFYYLRWDYYISCRSLDFILIFIIFQPWTHLSFVSATWNIWHPQRHLIHIWWSHMHLYKAVYHTGNAVGSLTRLNTENLLYH